MLVFGMDNMTAVSPTDGALLRRQCTDPNQPLGHLNRDIFPIPNLFFFPPGKPYRGWGLVPCGGVNMIDGLLGNSGLLEG